MTTGKLTKLIDDLIYAEETPRNYIGASSIGSDCLRQIWYEFKGEKGNEAPNKLRRTWDIGKVLEKYVIELLIECGLNISGPTSENYWWRYADLEFNYFQGHCDAIILDINNAILEVKTAKDSSFKQFVNHGCKKWNEKYYAQVQSYMGMSGMHKAYIIVLNKDNSDMWDECIDFDKSYYYGLLDKAKMIYEAQIPPPKINGSPLFFMCKMCKFRKVCHG